MALEKTFISHNDIELLRPGMELKYIGRGGYASEVPFADKILNRNQWYTIDFVEIGGWSTDIYFKGVEHKGRTVGFNSVMFRTEDEHRETEQLAYKLWEEAGCPDDRSKEFWAEAEKQLGC